MKVNGTKHALLEMRAHGPVNTLGGILENQYARHGPILGLTHLTATAPSGTVTAFGQKMGGGEQD